MLTFSQPWTPSGAPFFVALSLSLLCSLIYREETKSRLLSFFPSSKNLTTYCLNQIRSLLLSQESSLHIISRVIFFAFFSLQTNIAILKSVKQVREAVLRGLSSDSTMEIDFSYDANLQKIVANLVNMSDLLGFFPDLQQLYFRSVRRVYFWNGRNRDFLQYVRVRIAVQVRNRDVSFLRDANRPDCWTSKNPLDFRSNKFWRVFSGIAVLSR